MKKEDERMRVDERMSADKSRREGEGTCTCIYM